MKTVTNYDEVITENTPSNVKEFVKSAENLRKLAEENEVYMFIAFHTPAGYGYKMVSPEQFDSPQARKEYGKFNKFLQTVIDFNKDTPTFQAPESEN